LNTPRGLLLVCLALTQVMPFRSPDASAFYDPDFIGAEQINHNAALDRPGAARSRSLVDGHHLPWSRLAPRRHHSMHAHAQLQRVNQLFGVTTGLAVSIGFD
jgi:hypothetical protein